MSFGRVSVIVPCFNAASTLEATLTSVVEQTYSDIEVVVVDDGSTDETPSLLDRVSRPAWKRIRQPNAGQPAAINAGLSVATGCWIQFLDADDLLHPRKIESQLLALQGDVSKVSTSRWGRFYGDDPAGAVLESSGTSECVPPRTWLAREWADGGGMMFPARWLVSREVVERAGPWNPAAKGVNPDGEFFTRAVLASSEVVHDASSIAYYRSGVPGSMSAWRGSEALKSAETALLLIEAAVDPAPDEAALRIGLSRMWLRLARASYPDQPTLSKEAEWRARRWSDATLDLEGGWRFKVIARCFGWRAARRLQRWTGRP